LTGTRLRGRLAPQLFEALQLLKSGYRSGHICAAEQADARYSAIKEAFEILDNEIEDGLLN
jgi:hypothetical protein